MLFFFLFYDFCVTRNLYISTFDAVFKNLFPILLDSINDLKSKLFRFRFKRKEMVSDLNKKKWKI